MIAALEGYPYGDRPDEGAVVGQKFLHPDLKLQLKFPERWVIKNTPQALTARVRKEKVYFQLSIKKLSKRLTPQKVIAGLFPKRHINNLTKELTLGYPSAHARIMASAPHVSKAAIDVTVWLKDSEAFIMMMWTKRDEVDAYEKDFSAIRASLKPYDESVSNGIPRIALHIWKAGDSWQKLAKASNHILGHFTADRIAALNGMDLDETPKIGFIIKTVQ
jgi:predicted Zn-dependent protease